MGLLMDAGIDEIGQPGAHGVVSRPWNWRRTKRGRANGVWGGLGSSPPATANDARKGQPAGQRWVDVGPSDRLLAQGRVLARVDGVDVLVIRARRGTFAVENQCPHTGRPLTDAAVSGTKLICMGHQRRFDLTSGRAATRGTPIRVFDAAIVGDRLWLAPRSRDESQRSGAGSAAVDRDPVALPRDQGGSPLSAESR